MARVRNATASPGPAGRKRPREGSVPSSSSTRRRLDQATATPFSREGSPTKSVHFNRTLTQGPTVSGPAHRSQSPTRPAIHRRDEQDGSRSPSAQLHAEADAADLSPLRARYSSCKKGANASKSKVANDRKTNTGRTGRSKMQLGRPPLMPPREFEDLEDVYGRADTEIVMDSGPGMGDEEVCQQMDELRQSTLSFAHKHTSTLQTSRGQRQCDPLDELLVLENKHIVRYVGCVAQGSRSHISSWRELLEDPMCREALVIAIIGRALKEHVFNALYFGAPEKVLKRLMDEEQSLIDQDGFSRTQTRSTTIKTFEHTKAGKHTAPLKLAIAKVATQFCKILQPLLELDHREKHGSGNSAIFEDLSSIVAKAAELSRTLRSTRGVVYHWTSAFKDEEFDPSNMECFQLAEMIQNSPYDKKTVNGFERAILREGCEEKSQAIVRIVCFPGLVAYRQYGGALAKKELAAENNGRYSQLSDLPDDVAASYSRAAANNKLTGREGFRTRTIHKSLVHLQWGKQRLLTKEAGTSTHIDAMQGRNGRSMERYERDAKGFVELNDIYQEVLTGKSIEKQETEYRGKEKANKRSWFGLSQAE